MRKGILSILGAVAALMTTVLVLTQSQAASGKRPLGKPQLPRYKAGEIIVKLKKPQGLATYGSNIHALMGGLAKRYALSFSPFVTDKSIYKATVGGDVDLGQVLAAVKSNRNVAYAEPNWIYHTMDDSAPVDPVPVVLPNDPNFNLNWGLFNFGQKDSKGQDGIAGADIGATKAWATGTGTKDVLVAVIDTGVDYTHPDLKDNIYVNAAEVADDGKDNDGNGFVDDVHGWNFSAHNNDPMDDNKHGTHVSGTIGAQGNDGVGTAGVNWHVSILPIKFLGGDGSGSLEDAVESINYATLMGVKVMSNSWGGGGFSQTMFDSIKAAQAKGILFVAAAGNDGSNNDSSPAYPASYELENVMSVAATDNRDVKATWSNYGATKVHLAAPGVNIYSTVPESKGGYGTFSGTSMACPHVSGAAALLWSLNKEMGYADIKGRLMATVDPIRGLKRKVVTAGRLNVYNAINNIVPPRDEPPADQWKAVPITFESEHPYKPSAKLQFEVSHPGAKYIRVHFTKIHTESGYDVVKVLDGKGSAVEELSGKLTGDYITEYVEGDKATITFTADSSVNEWGFAIDRYEFVE